MTLQTSCTVVTNYLLPQAATQNPKVGAKISLAKEVVCIWQLGKF